VTKEGSTKTHLVPLILPLSSKGAPAKKIVEGVLKEEPWKTEKANKEAKKRQTKLKNEVKKQQKQERKKFQREL
jgi:hypothetical protein